MSTPFQLKIDPEKVHEIPMVDLAFEILKAANNPFYYRDLMNEVAKLRGLSEDEIKEVVAQLYTEINIDGRFACVGTNLWGLKRWYPVERSEDPVANSKRPRIINDDDDDMMDDEELFADEEDSYTSDEDFDNVDEEQDEMYGDEEEEAEVDDEAVMDDEELVGEDESEEDSEEEDEFDDFEEEEDK
ncbi:DNA-directed RNA polymerase subunit delta [Paenibacillus terrigena]|uniref:DNA-directed RNA polymerase subunit delta n=1 Tax=Paenibacillus terrigena TaxID=369333 RepID=UPI000374C4AB|nr:DNA-directed RNA polymerase subunit delta [Paenibacillus terrigena]